MAPLLSRRLECVLGLVRPCAMLADVGTDHALLPVAAVCRGVAMGALAADLREAPLCGARAHIEAAGIADRVVAVRGDGLLAVEHRAVDAVVIAGMSGDSMLRMIEAAPHVLATVQQLIIQPNQNVDKLRAWALRNGWHLRDEHMLEERGQFFVVCAFAPGAGADPAYSIAGWTEEALCNIGPWFLARKDVVALRWFERQRARVSHWVKRGVSRLQPDLERWDAACQAMRPSDAGDSLPPHAQSEVQTS
jgi:tRNA (adenine22-N1)-methyltransferase